MSRSLALLVSALLLVSCKTVSSDKRSRRSLDPAPSGDGTLPTDGQTATNTIKDVSPKGEETVMTPSATVGRKPVTTMEGKIWALPQNTELHNRLPSDTVSAIWMAGTNIYTIHPGLGLGISTNSGETWITKTVANGLGSTAANDVYAEGSDIYVATDNGLSISRDGGETWVLAMPGESYTRLAKGLDRLYVVGKTTMRVSADQGKSWTLASLPPDNCVSRLVVNGTKLYAAQNCSTGRLWRSLDEGKNWDPVGGDPFQNGVNDIVFAQGWIWVATNSGLYRSTDNGATWAAVTALPGKIAAFDGTSKKLYATVLEADATGVTKEIMMTSENRGETWTLDATTPPRVKAVGDRAVAIGGLGIRIVEGGPFVSRTAGGVLPPGTVSGITAFVDKIYVVGSAGVTYSPNSGSSWFPTKAEAFFKEPIGKLYVTPSTWYVPSPKQGLFVSNDLGSSWSVSTNGELTATSGPVAITSIGLSFALLTKTGLLFLETLKEPKVWTSRPSSKTMAADFLKKSGLRYYMGTAFNFSVSSDKGENWVTSNSLTRVTDMAEADGGRFYATTGTGFYVSTDLAAWKAVTGPQWAQAKYLTSVETQDKKVFVGADSGLFISEDNGVNFVFYPLGKVTGIALQGTTAYITTTQAVFAYNPAIKVR